MRLPAVRSVTIMLLASVAASAAAAQVRPSRRPVAMPPVPPVTGPLAIRVVYPVAGSLVDARDSSFIFGAVGSGGATLTINGQPVAVAPNGAFLGFVALPPETDPVLRLIARQGPDSAVLERRIRLPVRAAPPPPGRVWIDRAGIEPQSPRWLPSGEPVRVAVRASPGARLTLRLPDGRVVPLAPDTGTSVAYGPFDRRPTRAPRRDVARYVGVFDAEALGAALPADPMADVAPASESGPVAEVLAVAGADTARAALPLRLTPLEPGSAPVVVVGEAPDRAGAGHAVGMPGPGGPYEWLLANGTPAQVSGRIGEYVRLRLSRGASTWVTRSQIVAVLPAGTPPPATRVSLVRLVAGAAGVTARVALGGRVPFRVDEVDDTKLVLRLYSTTSNLNWVQYGSVDSLVRRIVWAQPVDDEVTVTFELAAPVFGFRTRWEGTDLLLEIRRPPAVDPRHPLRGRVIAVDPGHPPQGATGPTGLREADANLAVGLALRTLLEREGARVVMTRESDSALGLYDRTTIAEDADADLLISVHNNAFPDGVNPFANNGSSTYYFHPRAARLAALVQAGLLSEMGLRDLGFGRGDLALVRPTWMPAVLTEGAFLMIPEQENALRTPAFQEAYARGIVIGVDAWFRERFAAGR